MDTITLNDSSTVNSAFVWSYGDVSYCKLYLQRLSKAGLYLKYLSKPVTND